MRTGSPGGCQALASIRITWRTGENADGWAPPQRLSGSMGPGQDLRICIPNSITPVVLMVSESHLEDHWLKPKPAGPGSGISPEPQCQVSKVQGGKGWAGGPGHGLVAFGFCLVYI